MYSLSVGLKDANLNSLFLMVTHLIIVAKKTNSIFTILTMYHYTMHIERLKTFFFTAAIQIYCDAITETETQPTHAMQF